MAFGVENFSGATEVVATAVAGVAGAAATAVAASSTRAALRRAQRRNEVEILRVRNVIAGDKYTVEKSTRGYGESKGVELNLESLDAYEVTTDRVRPHAGGSSPVLTPEERILTSMEKRSEARFQIQTEHYANALRQSTSYFYLSMFVGIIGFILLMVGVGLGVGGLVEIGAVTGAGGVLVEGAAGLIFNQANKAKADAQANLAAIALAQERDENRQMALIYSSRITDPALRDSTNVELARKSLESIRPSADPPALPPGGGTPAIES
ncbi:MAG: TRADD-N-associated membrane domain-containing protein [Thermomicrobiales bacterium]